MPGEVTRAEYHADEERIEWAGTTADGVEVEGTLTKRAWGPETELDDDAMKTLAAELPGTPVYGDEVNGPFDPETVPSIGLVVD